MEITMSKMNEKSAAKTETVKPTETTQPVATAPVAPTKTSKFVRTLEAQVASFVQTQKLSEVPADLEVFLGWSRNNPPAEKVGTPSGDSVTGKVWAYCDQLVASKATFTRKDVVDALVAQGLNRATVSTQYQRWSKARGAVAA